MGANGEIYSNGVLLLSQWLNIVALIPKSDKDQRFITNWRPLTLLETFYKLISATLANRMKPVLDKIIGQQQMHKYQVDTLQNVHPILTISLTMQK